MSIQDELLRKQQAEGRLMAQNTGATTAALPENQLPISSDPQISGPAGAGGNAPVEGAPLSQGGANESPPAGPDLIKERGDPTTMIENMPAGELEATLERSAQSIANAKPATEGALVDPKLQDIKTVAQKLQMNAAMTAQGANPEKGLKALRDKRLKDYAAMRKKGEITVEHHTELKSRWKNIFNIVPKEDMGLFLMDFGFRAMMAGESMGDVGAIGAAGAGALAGSQGRRQAKVDAEISDYDKAEQGALDERASDTAARKGPDTINTESGVMQWDADQDAYVMIKDEKGNPVMPSSLAGRPSVKQWEIDAWMKAYPEMTKQEATARALSGVDPEEAQQEARKEFGKQLASGSVFIPGKNQIRSRNITDADREAFIDEYTRSGRISGQGALPDEGGQNADGIYTVNPGWSESEWATYKEATGQ